MQIERTINRLGSKNLYEQNTLQIYKNLVNQQIPKILSSNDSSSRVENTREQIEGSEQEGSEIINIYSQKSFDQKEQEGFKLHGQHFAQGSDSKAHNLVRGSYEGRREQDQLRASQEQGFLTMAEEIRTEEASEDQDFAEQERLAAHVRSKSRSQELKQLDINTIEEESEVTSVRKQSQDDLSIDFKKTNQKTPRKSPHSVQNQPHFAGKSPKPTEIKEVDEEAQNFQPPHTESKLIQEKKKDIWQKIINIDKEIELFQQNVLWDEPEDASEPADSALAAQSNKKRSKSEKNEVVRKKSAEQRSDRPAVLARKPKQKSKDDRYLQKFKKQYDNKIDKTLKEDVYQHRGVYLYERALLNLAKK